MSSLIFRWYAATHFEAEGARRVFPCFDEPEYKAIFQLQVTNHKNYSVISNTQVNSKTFSETDDERVTTTFKPTPVMSTYILAILISDFLKVTNKRTNHSIYFPLNANSDGVDFALQLEDRFLKNYEEYFDFRFEMNKIDFAAVPVYKGGLESWGLIIFE